MFRSVIALLLLLPSWAASSHVNLPAIQRVKSSDFAGVRFVRLSDFVAKPECPCKCPCVDGKPCDCKKCECKDCPGKPKNYGYREARLDAINRRAGLIVWVGMSPPRLRSGSVVHVREELGWVNPWGQVVNQPTKLEFYYEGGKIWLVEPEVSQRAPVNAIRTFRSAGC